MRSIDPVLLSRLRSLQQTYANNADPMAIVWISRPTIPLKNPEFLERQLIRASADITDVAIAACHPIMYRPVTKLYAGYVSNGFARVESAVAREAMAAHEWFDTGFHEPASAIAIEFDGRMRGTGGAELSLSLSNILGCSGSTEGPVCAATWWG
jgi:hypothetical protein